MTGREWIEYFKSIHGREPSNEEYSTAKAQGEFQEDQLQGTVGHPTYPQYPNFQQQPYVQQPNVPQRPVQEPLAMMYKQPPTRKFGKWLVVLGILLTLLVTGFLKMMVKNSLSNGNTQTSKPQISQQSSGTESRQDVASVESQYLQYTFKINDAVETYSDGVYYTNDSEISQDEMDFYLRIMEYANDFSREEFFGVNYVKPSIVFYRSSIGVTVDSSKESQELHDSQYIGGTIFIDLAQLDDKAPEPAQKVAVLTHELGHHMQNQVGAIDAETQYQKIYADQNRMDIVSQLSIRLELQADYFAGAFANYLADKNLYNYEDLKDAIEVTNSLGDDVLLGDAYDENKPEADDHGTGEQRSYAFAKGYKDRAAAQLDYNQFWNFDVTIDEIVNPD